MGQRLTTLVKGCTDIPLLDYVIQELPRGLSPLMVTNKSGSYLQRPLMAAYQRKVELLWGPFRDLAKYLRQEERAQLQRERAALARDKVQSVRALSREQTEVLQKQLADAEPGARLEAVAAAALAFAHVEADLIARLDDQDADVRRAARQALVRLARGTDFGPTPRARKAERGKAQERWRAWLALQQDRPVPAAPDGLGVVKVALPVVNPEAARHTEELLAAPAGRRSEVLARLRDGEGPEHTEALAAAIPQLPEAAQAEARTALFERLTRMTAAALRDLLRHDDAEVRHAAARACARKDARNLIPDLLPLLEDAEPFVAGAAHQALKALTGEDFGPRAEAALGERQVAVAAWKAWWARQQKKAQ